MTRLLRTLAALVSLLVGAAAVSIPASVSLTTDTHAYDLSAARSRAVVGTSAAMHQSNPPSQAVSRGAAYGYDPHANLARTNTRLDVGFFAPQTTRVADLADVLL